MQDKKFNNNSYFFGAMLLITVFFLYYILHPFFNFEKITQIEYLRQSIIGFGVAAPIIYMLIMALAIIISPIPSLPLSAASGIIWGPFLGTIYSVIGALIGAIISFLIARHLGRKLITKLLHKHIVFCNKCNELTLTWIILIARLFPFFQFDIISYGAGLTNMRLKNFALATFFGMIPMTYVFTTFGQGVFIGKSLSIIFSLCLIIGMFLFPILINKYNIFGLKDKIKITNVTKKGK